jgi:murein DD-endopeptidase / murein LD-carboxypeptidase
MRFLRLFILPLLLASLAACHSARETGSTSTAAEASRSVMSKYAAMMRVPEKELDRKLIHFVDAWYAVPYKYGGSEKTGIDCSHLMCRIYKDVYGKKVGGTAVDLEKMSDDVKESKLRQGDLVFFKIESTKVSHVGMYIANNHFVHASVKKGVIINSLDDKYYKKYFYKGGRIQ